MKLKKTIAASPADQSFFPLLPPSRTGGKSVMAALWNRKTDRAIGGKKISPQMLSDLLWAAGGVNRKKGPFNGIGRTAATASNSQEIDLYVALPTGIYLYDAVSHSLSLKAAGDLRILAIGRGQGGGTQAPVRLIYVADIDKYLTAGFMEPGLKDPEIQKSYFYSGAGLMAGNVYLFAAARGLAAWFHNCDRKGLAAALRLRPSQRALFGQTVGYAAKK
jgi:hypothetical protein